MADETSQPLTGADEEADAVARAGAFLDRFEAERDDTPLELQPSEPEEGQAPEVAEQPEEPEAQEAQPADEFELVYDGQTLKKSRAEVIELAQKGHDYTQKTMAVAEQNRAVQANLQRAQEMVNLAPVVAQDLATVKALEAHLAQYQGMDWVRLATDDPLEYPKVRAQYDLAVQSYQQAVGTLQQNAQAYSQHQSALAQHTIQQEAQSMRAIIPEWQSAETHHKEAGEVAKYLVSRGVPEDAVARLGFNQGDSTLVAIARDAWKYRELQKGKDAKVGQVRSAPPIPKPGASSTVVRSQKTVQLETRFKRSGEVNDAAALLLNRWK